MTPEIFAEWLRRQGHKIIKTPSSYWADSGPRVFQAFPYHWIIQPDESEIREFIAQESVISLRYSTPMTNPQGMASYHAVLGEKHYDLEYLSPNSRSKVRRGLKRSSVGNISLDQLAREGWELQHDTIERQGRHGSMTREEWERICLSAKGLAGFEGWGAFVDSNLAATILTALVDNVCYMLYPQSHRKYFGEYVNNALSYTITHEMLSNREVREVFYGLHSLDAPPSVDEFKFRMGYTAKPVRQRVVFHPWMRPFINPASHALLRAGLKFRPGNPMLSKAEGMLRFYLQGHLPLCQQSLPPPLQTN